MDKHVIAIIHPFVRQQTIYVYINGECIKIVECTIDEMDEKIYELCVKYDIDRVDFQGGQLYALKFKDEFLANKFGAKILKVFIH